MIGNTVKNCDIVYTRLALTILTTCLKCILGTQLIDTHDHGSYDLTDFYTKE